MKFIKIFMLATMTLTLASCCAIFGNTSDEGRMVWTPTQMAKEDAKVASARCNREHKAHFGGNDGKDYSVDDRIWDSPEGPYAPFCGKAPMPKCEKGHSATPAGIYQACMERAGFVLKMISRETCTLGGEYGHG